MQSSPSNVRGRNLVQRAPGWEEWKGWDGVVRWHEPDGDGLCAEDKVKRGAATGPTVMDWLCAGNGGCERGEGRAS